MLLGFVVCMALLASFFLPSASLINMYAIRIIFPIHSALSHHMEWLEDQSRMVSELNWYYSLTYNPYFSSVYLQGFIQRGGGGGAWDLPPPPSKSSPQNLEKYINCIIALK